jgi:hypothetical protein
MAICVSRGGQKKDKPYQPDLRSYSDRGLEIQFDPNFPSDKLWEDDEPDGNADKSHCTGDTERSKPAGTYDDRYSDETALTLPVLTRKTKISGDDPNFPSDKLWEDEPDGNADERHRTGDIERVKPTGNYDDDRYGDETFLALPGLTRTTKIPGNDPNFFPSDELWEDEPAGNAADESHHTGDIERSKPAGSYADDRYSDETALAVLTTCPDQEDENSR